MPEVYIHRDIKDSSSPLVLAIDCTSTLDSTSKWIWDSLLITQGGDENYDEYISCFYFGHYKDENVQVYWRVIAPTTRIVDETIVRENHFQPIERFYIEITPTKATQFVNCEKDYVQYSCLIARQYEKTIVILRFGGDGQIDMQAIEEIVNETLLKIEDSIVELNK